MISHLLHEEDFLRKRTRTERKEQDPTKWAKPDGTWGESVKTKSRHLHSQSLKEKLKSNVPKEKARREELYKKRNIFNSLRKRNQE